MMNKCRGKDKTKIGDLVVLKDSSIVEITEIRDKEEYVYPIGYRDTRTNLFHRCRFDDILKILLMDGVEEKMISVEKIDEELVIIAELLKDHWIELKALMREYEDYNAKLEAFIKKASATLNRHDELKAMIDEIERR